MKLFDFSERHAAPITQYGSTGTSALALGHGTGASHSYCIYCEPGGEIGAHPTGFGQLLLVIQGTGWVASSDGTRRPLATGQGAHFERGELHSKGSDDGGVFVMIQCDDLEATAPAVRGE